MVVTKLKKKAWDEFSRYIRLRDCLKTTGEPDHGLCVTCLRDYPFKSLQGGHFIPGRKNIMLFDEEMVNAQCYSCNIHLKGNWPAYYEVMVKRHGTQRVEEMLANRHTILQFKAFELEEKIQLYKDKSKALLSS